MQHAFNFLTTQDPTLKAVIENYGFPNIQIRQEGFASMCHIILEQQVSIESARATFRKLTEHLKTVTPKKVLNTSDQALRNCGISRQKIGYLKDMASRVENKTLDFTVLANLPEREIREKLLEIKGVGNWTVEVYLMFCLQLPDVIPFGDIAIRNAITKLYGCQSVGQMAELALQWQPYRTYASHILWHDYLARRGRKI